jgi:hypothetical protein
VPSVSEDISRTKPLSPASLDASRSVSIKPPASTNRLSSPNPSKPMPPVMSGVDIGVPCDWNSVVRVNGIVPSVRSYSWIIAASEPGPFGTINASNLARRLPRLTMSLSIDVYGIPSWSSV